MYSMYSIIQFNTIKYIVKLKFKKQYPKLQDNIVKYLKYHTIIYYKKVYNKLYKIYDIWYLKKQCIIF